VEAESQRVSRRRSREEVQEAVRESLVKLLREGSFKDVTVDELARAAGISRTAFYFYYGSKNEVLMAAAEETSAEVYAEADRWWHGAGPPEELVRAALEGIAAVYLEHAEIMRAAVEATTYDDEFKTFYTALMERFVSATADHLRRERDAGRLRELDLEPVAEALVWMAERCNHAFLLLEDRPVRDVVESLTTIWVHALYPDP
jgi:TetR/AcrR family transcriptional regulator, ethionamide resistance regulator